jgi:hypothetical protein
MVIDCYLEICRITTALYARTADVQEVLCCTMWESGLRIRIMLMPLFYGPDPDFVMESGLDSDRGFLNKIFDNLNLNF